MSLLELWKTNLSKVKSERTTITYTHALNSFLKHLGVQEDNISNIDPKLIYTYVDESDLSTPSILTHLSAIKHFYKFMLKRGYISKDTFVEVENIINDIREELSHKVHRSAPKALTKSEVQTIMKHVENSKYEKVYTLLLSSGVRLSEYLYLRAENFYMDKSSILWVRLPAQITKRKKERISPIMSYDRDSTYRVMEKILKWIENYEENFRVSRGALQVFTHRLSRRLLIDFSIHSFRHTYITNLVNSGFSAELVKEFAGHSSVRTTIDVYYRFSQERARKMVEEFLR